MSDRGRIRRSISADPHYRNGHLLKGTLDKDGYTKLILMHEGQRVDKRLHMLVLEVFVGPRPKGCWGLHRDDDKANNTLKNLRWAPHRENYKDWIRNGGSRQGSCSGKAKLTERQVVWARKAYTAKRFNQYELAEKLKVNRSCVTSFINRKTWTHV